MWELLGLSFSNTANLKQNLTHIWVFLGKLPGSSSITLHLSPPALLYQDSNLLVLTFK